MSLYVFTFGLNRCRIEVSLVICLGGSLFPRTQCIYVCVWYMHMMRVSREKTCYCKPSHAHTHTCIKSNVITNTAINADRVRRGCLHIIFKRCSLLLWINYCYNSKSLQSESIECNFLKTWNTQEQRSRSIYNLSKVTSERLIQIALTFTRTE